MAEMDGFESRLAGALDRLADEIPTAVDAAEVARGVASAGARRGRWALPIVDAHRRVGVLAPALRFAIAPALLLMLVLGLFALGQRIAPVSSGSVTGSMSCSGTTWTASSSAAEDLGCTIDLGHARLAGRARLQLGVPSPMNEVLVRSGTMTLQTPGRAWSGAASITTAPNGMAVGEAVLTTEGPDDVVLVLGLRLVSADGLQWGLLGTVGSPP